MHNVTNDVVAIDCVRAAGFKNFYYENKNIVYSDLTELQVRASKTYMFENGSHQRNNQKPKEYLRAAFKIVEARMVATDAFHNFCHGVLDSVPCSDIAWFDRGTWREPTWPLKQSKSVAQQVAFKAETN